MSVDWILHAATKVTWLRWEWKWFKKCINFNFNVSGRIICNVVIYVTGSIFRTLVMGLNGMDVIVKLATLDEFDDVNYLNQTIWLW